MPQHMDWASEEPCLTMLYYTAKCTDLNWKLELKAAGPKGFMSFMHLGFQKQLV